MKHLISEALPLATIKQRAIIQSILRFPKPSEKQKYLLNSILSDILKNKEIYQKRAEKKSNQRVAPKSLIAQIDSNFKSPRLTDWDRNFINTIRELPHISYKQFSVVETIYNKLR